MKLGVVKYDKSLNYGDDIQTIAAARLLPKVDYYLDREHLNTPITNEKINLITNGWFMDNPKNWPPASNINPLFISFHITHHNNSISLLANKNLIEYYKKHEPIGCRDHHTVRLFESIGVKAYFSGCLTMTLQNTTTEFEKNEEILFVDAFNASIPPKMRKKIFDKLVPKSIRNNIVYETHFHNDIQNTEQRFTKVENLINRYSKAHLIVTSRIHVALPAIALGTPVLFLDLGFNSLNTRNRFGGIINYFNTLNKNTFPFTDENYFSNIYKKLRLYNIYYPAKLTSFDWENPPKPTDEFNDLANKMRDTIFEFIKPKMYE